MSDPSRKTPDFTFFYWGPLLFHIKLRSKDLEELAKLCSKKSSLVNDTLAGVIKHEHYVSVHKYFKIIEHYLPSFRQTYSHWYGRPLGNKIIMNSSWVNFMIAGEYNPPHIHSECDFSSVLFIKVPEKLKEEHQKFTGNGGGPGSISFMYGESQPHAINYKYFFPQEGDFFIFPAMLRHFVSPFLSEGERVSVSANFQLE